MENEYKYGWNEDLNQPLIQKMKQDLKHAVLHKNEAVRDAIRVAMGEFPTKITIPITLESGKKSSRPKKDDEIENDDIIAVLIGLSKSEKQTLELKKEESSKYLEVLHLYLPENATPDQIRLWIRENIDFSLMKSPMQAMAQIMRHFGRKADGNTVKTILQEIAGQ